MGRRDLVFFLSGCAALVEEEVWSRLLGRTLGSDAAGTGVVIGVFLFGLGAGALALAGPARRARDPRRLFFLLEAVVAVWALASPFVLELLAPVSSLGARLAVAATFLLIPTFAMGGTFPVMGRLAIGSAADAGAETSRFYGANTLGAAAGALSAPFLLLPLFGFRGALAAAAALDLVAAGLALALPAAPRAEAAASGRRAPWRLLLLAPLLLGFASLAYEVALVRVLITLTGASVYAFAIVLAVYLLGLGAGSRQAAGWLARPGSARRVLFWCAALAPLLALGGLLVLKAKIGEPLGAPLGNLILPGTSPERLWLGHALLAALALLLPALAFGAALPAAVAAHVEADPELAREPLLGRVYAANTLGSTLGALVCTFVLLPHGAPFAVRVALGAAFLGALPLARGRVGLLLACAAGAALAQGPALGGGTAPGVIFHAVGPVASASVTEKQ